MNKMIDHCAVNRGHETEEHRAAKHMAMQALADFGFHPVLCEHCYGDVVGYSARNRLPSTLIVEVERSNRNLLRNIDRDLASGGDAVLVLCPQLATMGEISRKLSRELPTALHDRVGIASLAVLRLLRPTTMAGTEPSTTTKGTNENPVACSH